MFDPQFVSLLIKYKKFVNYIELHRANYGMMESKLRYNYRRVKTSFASIDEIFDDCYVFTNQYDNFISYYDGWYYNYDKCV
jgi:hypothetical protein